MTPHFLTSLRCLAGCGALLLLAACSPPPHDGSPFYLASPHDPPAPTPGGEDITHPLQHGGGMSLRDVQPGYGADGSPLSPGMAANGGSTSVGAGSGQ